MRSVCVSCNYRQEGQHRNCPKCGWMMIDGPLPNPGSIRVPRKPFSWKRFANAAAAPALCAGVMGFLGIVSAIAGPAPVPAATPAPILAVSTPAPVETPALRLAAAVSETVVPAATPAPKPVAKKAPAKKSSKKKTIAKKSTAKKQKNVARR